MKRIAALLLLFPLLATFAAASDTQKQRQQKEQERTRIELRLREADQRAGTLAGRASGVREESRREFRQLMDELAQKRQLAMKKLAELGSLDNQNWDRVKVEANAAIDDFNTVYERILSLLRKP